MRETTLCQWRSPYRLVYNDYYLCLIAAQNPKTCFFHALGYVRHRGGDEGTGGNSNGRGKNKQQLTKSSLPPRPRCCQAAAAKLPPLPPSCPPLQNCRCRCCAAAAAAALRLHFPKLCCCLQSRASAKLPPPPPSWPPPPRCRCHQRLHRRRAATAVAPATLPLSPPSCRCCCL